MTITIQQFEDIALYVSITVLVGYMIFIVYDLAKSSNAGKYGYFVLFLALGLGLVGFLAKTIITQMMGI